jgi:5-methyltetrahydrofolate--homocysteine methyltransferase
MIIVGERLNSSRKSVFEAFQTQNAGFFVDQALRQEQAGARYIDVNAAALLDDEVDALRWVLPILQEKLSVPLSIDTPNARAAEEGLKLCAKRPLLNSLTLESRRLDQILPLVRKFKPRVIALCLDDEGLAQTPARAAEIAKRAKETLVREGLEAEDIFIDPLVRPIGAEPAALKTFVDSIPRLKHEVAGIRTIAGISNVSFGLPLRPALNRALIVLAVERGLDAAICDPLDEELQSLAHAALALAGRDPGLKQYLKFARARAAAKKNRPL